MAGAPINLIPKLMEGGLFPLLNLNQCSVPPRKPSNAHTVIGHSMSKSIKKMSKIFTGCCLLLPLIILIKLWNSHAKRVAGLWRWRALGDSGGKKTLRYQLSGYCFFHLKKIIHKPTTARYVYRWWCFMRYWTLNAGRGKKPPATVSRSWSISPSNSAQDLWLQAVFLCNNALLIFFLSRVHNERKVSSKTKGQSLARYQYLEASCLHFVMRVHFSVLEWQDFQSEGSRKAQCDGRLGRILWSDIAVRQWTLAFAEPGGKLYPPPMANSPYLHNTCRLCVWETLHLP